MSRETLAQHDGTDANKPLLIAVKGYVFDVSSGSRFYGPGASYHALVGKDCTQAVARMSLHPSHLNDDMSSLSQQHLESLSNVFKTVYLAKYPIVAYVEDSPFVAGNTGDTAGAPTDDEL